MAGDLCLDRMTAGLPWRERYRERLGLRDGQRLVVASSTWGPGSLLGRRPELLGRLLGELPVDEYRVAAVVHPNVWHGHGAWQLRAWLADCRKAGLLLIPPREGWRAAVVAADCVLGDHGSVTLYGAAVGRPVALAAFDADDVDPETAMGALARSVPHIDADAPLRPQVEDAIGRHDAARCAEIAEMAVAERGGAASILRRLMYELMGLPEPASAARAAPVPPAVPEPPEWGHGRPALLAVCEVIGADVRVVRFAGKARPSRPAHLVVDDSEVDERLRELADIIVRRPEAPGPLAWVSGERVFAALPACRMVADVADGRCLVLPRGGGLLRVEGAWPDPAVFASAVLACLDRGRDMPRRVLIGRTAVPVTVT
ncbi:hypothetical protein [Spirillospora sp. NBC_01491]|uniref:hypothetical protein n=1 Tax=Spirillospora sp. NBC_01491 TaxID=2976007 RepID=UPI002E30C46D|nr:hypothetical protein [Spirillospora sp. NBC_01491]